MPFRRSDGAPRWSGRWSGNLQRLGIDPAATGRMALVRRAPRAPVFGIAPFNVPPNLVAHKVAPAIAAGARSWSSPPQRHRSRRC